MSGMGEKEIVIMYHYVEDKVFIKDMKYLCSNIINQLVQLINNDSVMKVKAHLVGSGAKNLITQNSNEPIDLDYNLMIIDSEININNCRGIKEYIRKQFNVILNKNGWSDCMDSTSALTTEKRHFVKGNHTEFSIDLAIVYNNRDGWYRLIHRKTGFSALDQYYWNKVPDSKGLSDRVARIKDEHLWNEVIDEYLKKKNMYLRRLDYYHPSFNVYVETVNQVFDKYFKYFGWIPLCPQQVYACCVSSSKFILGGSQGFALLKKYYTLTASSDDKRQKYGYYMAENQHFSGYAGMFYDFTHISNDVFKKIVSEIKESFSQVLL